MAVVVGEAATDTAPPVWFDSGIRLTTGTARVLSSTGECATSGPSQRRAASAREEGGKRGKKRQGAASLESKGGLFTSRPFLLPCTVGKRLLGARETPFVAVLRCRFKESAAPGGASQATAPSADKTLQLAFPLNSWLER